VEPIFTGRPGWKRVYLDLPGHGRTPAEEWIRSNDQMVDVVVEFLEGMLGRDRFALVGLSYGGYLARGVVQRLRERIDGLLLWVPARYPREDRHTPAPTVLVENPAVVAEASTDAEKEYLSVAVVPDRETLAWIRAYAVPAAAASNEKFLAAVTGGKLSSEAQDSPFQGPTLIVCGRQDAIVGYRDQWELVEQFPRATFAVLDGAGHFLGATEQVGLFRALFGDWLDRLDSWQPPTPARA